MRWNTPLSDAHADHLLGCLDIRPGMRILDLGCGWGELLLRAVDMGGGAPPAQATGVGVDTDEQALKRARSLAAGRDLGAQVTFVREEATAWREPADRVLCIGAAHAFGGSVAALEALAGMVTPGGRVLFGDGCWEVTPTAAAAAIFGTEVLPLGDLIEQALASGWRLLHFSTADQREWDEFESSWSAGRQEWLLAHPDDPRSTEVRDQLDSRLRDYVSGYRGVLGFGYFVLAR